MCKAGGVLGNPEPGEGQGEENGEGGVGAGPGWVLYQKSQGANCFQKREWPVVLQATGQEVRMKGHWT